MLEKPNLADDQIIACLRVVDWDGLLFAPRERDLMFVGGEPLSPLPSVATETLFFQGYGEGERDCLALAYYRYEWAVQEMGDYGERVFLLADIGEETRAGAVRGFASLFAPGEVVESACQAEEWLSISSDEASRRRCVRR